MRDWSRQSLLDAAAGQFTIHTHCILYSGKRGFRLKLFSELEHHLTRNVLKSLCRYSDSPSPKRASRGRSRSRTPPRRSDHLIPVLFLCHSVISVLLYARSISGKPMNEKLWLSLYITCCCTDRLAYFMEFTWLKLVISPCKNVAGVLTDIVWGWGWIGIMPCQEKRHSIQETICMSLVCLPVWRKRIWRISFQERARYIISCVANVCFRWCVFIASLVTNSFISLFGQELMMSVGMLW